jgi:hypothetical protein
MINTIDGLQSRAIRAVSWLHVDVRYVPMSEHRNVGSMGLADARRSDKPSCRSAGRQHDGPMIPPGYSRAIQ